MNRSIQYKLDLLSILTKKELKVRYKSSFLGYLWSVAYPLAMAAVFYIAFKIVMKIQIENYTLFLMAGLFPWQWFGNSVGTSPMVLLSNASLIKKVNFPRQYLVLTMVTQDMIHFILAIPVIVLFVFIYKLSPHWSWLYGIPLLCIIQFLLTYGFSLILSGVNLFVRDLERLTSIFITLLFYCTPVFYSETMIPEKFKYLIDFNPLSPLMISWRHLFLTGQINNHYLLLSTVYSLGILLAGKIIFNKLSWKFAEVL